MKKNLSIIPLLKGSLLEPKMFIVHCGSFHLLLISDVVFSLFLEVLEAILIGTFCASPSSSSIAEAEATPEYTEVEVCEDKAASGFRTLFNNSKLSLTFRSPARIKGWYSILSPVGRFLGFLVRATLTKLKKRERKTVVINFIIGSKIGLLLFFFC